MGYTRVALLLCVCLLAAVTAAQDLYEVLGVSASATPAQMKKAYVLSLAYCIAVSSLPHTLGSLD